MPKHISETPATQFLRRHQVIFSEHPYAYEEHGGTAVSAVFGKPLPIMKNRGRAFQLDDQAQGFVTVHPSFLLRMPDEAARKAAYADFVADLKAANALLA